jgi:hypothetical protein
MTDDRRSEKRISTNRPTKWVGLSGMYDGRLEDISLGGCFINSDGHVEVGELVSVEIQLLSGEWLALRGEVTYAQPGIGFGLLFNFLTDEQERALKELFI